METSSEYGLVDLSKIDFEALKKQFENGRKRIEAEKLRLMIAARLAVMCALNHTRLDYYETFRQMIDDYNSGAANIEEFFKRLMAFAQTLNEEDRRGVSEGLTEDELAIFDLLTKPAPELSRDEKEQVKKAARELLEKLKTEKLVLDWRKRQQTRADVLVTVQYVLDQELPTVYSQDIYKQKCDVVYQHIYDSYYGQGRSVYNPK